MLSATIACIQSISLWATDSKARCGLRFCLSLLQETNFCFSFCLENVLQPTSSHCGLRSSFFHLWAWKEESSTFQSQLLLPQCQKFVACSSLWVVLRKGQDDDIRLLGSVPFSNQISVSRSATVGQKLKWTREYQENGDTNWTQEMVSSVLVCLQITFDSWRLHTTLPAVFLVTCGSSGPLPSHS